MALEPIPCDCGAGTGGEGPPQFDAEQNLLCDVGPDGQVLGTALMVTEYNQDGSLPAGPPVPYDPATGLPYVVQGTLQPCSGEIGCLQPVAFHFTTTQTGPVDHPGRQYDLDLPINPGFAVQSLQVDQVTSAANIVWDVADPDGEQFRQDLTAFIDARIPASATVTITNPNAGQTICGTAQPMHIHIECVRLDQNPPNLIELLYNGGEDLIINPAYNETPPLNPPVSQGNYGFHLLARQDDPGPFPGNQPANRANCTNVANRGWETNDVGRTFEIWGQDQVNGQNVTPTPRGTPVQEMTSDGAPPGGRSTIWQTFQAPATGNFVIRVVHGARDAGENHRITLDNGDTNDAQNGDLIDDVTNPGVVTSSPGGPGPWTTFTQTIPLTAGNVYTLALSSNNPVAPNRGGLFTDMRAYLDRPDLRATATTDDDTCVVTVDETTTVCDDQYWAAHCSNGEIVSWENVETNQVLDPAAFWGQAPAPVPGNCPATAAAGSGGSVAANLVQTYTVCGVVGGVRQNVQRVVITDASGGVLADQFIGEDGAPVNVTDYTIGACGDPETLGAVCYATNPPTVPRRGFLVLNADGTTSLYSESGALVPGGSYTIVICPELTQQSHVLCDGGNDNHQFLRWYVDSPIAGVADQQWDFELDGSTPYVPVGPVGVCFADETGDWEPMCYTLTGFPDPIAGWALLGNPDVVPGPSFPGGIVYFTSTGTVLDASADGFQVVPCGGGSSDTRDAELQILCDANGTRFLRKYLYDGETGAFDSFVNTTLDGTTPFAPVGAVTVCASAASDTRDAEILVLCDSTPTRFLRKYLYDGEDGTFVTVVNTTLDGTTPFAPVGAVGVCSVAVQTDFDFLSTVLCDANGTQFIQRLTFNSATGAVTATTNTTLTGGAFVPVGAVSLCSNCCPIEIGEGCYNAGSGRYTALRLANGTISLIDSVTGAAVNAANIIPCANDDTVRTLTAQHRLIADADAPWTPGADVVGTLTSVTYTVLSGTATVIDQNGTVAAGLPPGLSVTWNAEDDNTLSGPTSIDAIGGQTYVNWTQR